MINKGFENIEPSYLFRDIGRKVAEFTEQTGIAPVKMGIGDATEALPPVVVEAMHKKVAELGVRSSFTGYGNEPGNGDLREALASYTSQRGAEVAPSEIFVTDGAKPLAAAISRVFDEGLTIAVQDPAYPVYVDSNKISRNNVVTMPCNKENGFFPSEIPEGTDMIYLCSPNNPTGAVASRDQLQRVVDFARDTGAVIINDIAYEAFIQDDSPRSIYEIEGAKECAIQMGSFSKMAGFTGVRLGWVEFPEELRARGVEPGKLYAAFNRRQGTEFNAACNVAQAGGLAALTQEGQEQCGELIDHYMANAGLIREGLGRIGIEAHGGDNSPFVWLRAPNGMDSWDFFDKSLNEANVVGTPGSGFGPSGEGYFRLSAFGSRELVEDGMNRLETRLDL